MGRIVDPSLLSLSAPFLSPKEKNLIIGKVLCKSQGIPHDGPTEREKKGGEG